MECIVIIIIGAITGWLGSETNEGRALLCCKIIAGITGAGAGYWLFVQPGVHIENGIIQYLISTAVGAIAAVEITNLFKKRIHVGYRSINLAVLSRYKKLSDKRKIGMAGMQNF